MQEDDFDRFNALMLGIAENYGQSLSPEGIALRFQMLSSFSIAEVEKAALGVIANRKYTTMPTVADFIEHLGGGNIEDQAMLEAAKILQAIARVGRYNSVTFDDATTMAVIQQGFGGWPKLCEECGTKENEKWIAKDFAKIWAAYKRQGKEAHGYLPGLTEITNSHTGYYSFIPLPKLIGNQAKARQILLTAPKAELNELEKYNINAIGGNDSPQTPSQGELARASHI